MNTMKFLSDLDQLEAESRDTVENWSRKSDTKFKKAVAKLLASDKPLARAVGYFAAHGYAKAVFDYNELHKDIA